MPDFLLELRSEEIPARMQERARADLARLFADELGKAGLKAGAVATFSTPRRLALIARDLPAETAAVREELKGPRSSAPPQALDGFLRKTGLAKEQLEERDGVYFAVIDRPGRATAAVLAEAIPAIVRAFPWPKSMRWGAASLSTESLRWVRPLQGIVAILGEDVVPLEIDGIASGAATVGHRFHHPGPITIGSAADYADKLRMCHVIVDHDERRRIIADGARAAAAAAGLVLVEDEGLLTENAGLTEWPVPLLGRFDPAFLQVPREVIQLTMRTNQKYFACVSASPGLPGEGDRAQHGGGAGGEADGQNPPLRSGPLHQPSAGPPPRAELGEASLAPAFVCVANIDASDGGAAIVAGNEKVLAARLSDAKFFWEQDLKVPLEERLPKLADIVFHEKLGTVADKVERVAKLARWLCEEGIIQPSPLRGEGRPRSGQGEGQSGQSGGGIDSAPLPAAASPRHPLPGRGEGWDLATLAETAARLCKADLVTGMVGEFPELQGVMGGYYARAQGLPDAVADAIRDHYKPVGQGDAVPTAPVTVAVSLADKLDTLAQFFFEQVVPTGSKDPFALRRLALATLGLLTRNEIRVRLSGILKSNMLFGAGFRLGHNLYGTYAEIIKIGSEYEPLVKSIDLRGEDGSVERAIVAERQKRDTNQAVSQTLQLLDFFADRLKVQQREAGVRHDLIDAVFALGGEDDLVRLLARVRALQAFMETAEGRDLLAGYKRAANILKKENWTGAPLADDQGIPQTGEEDPMVMVDDPVLADALRTHESAPAYAPAPEEAALVAALDAAEPRAEAAVAAEDFEGAMAALATLRGPVDAFFDRVTVNDADPVKRAARLDILLRIRSAVHRVADFSKIEG